jgi:phenylalanine-4-hydroxylase
VQPIYFVAESFEKAKKQIAEYCENINRPFNVSYNTATNTIEVDRKIKTREEREEEGGLKF